jgi:hypothetical protein
MQDFHQVLMLGRVLELSEHTARKVDTIEARQMGLIQRIAKLESEPSPKASQPVSRVALALMAFLAALLANIKAESVGVAVASLIRGLGSP